MKFWISILFLIFVSSIPVIYAEQNMEIELVYPTGDRAAVNRSILIIESTDGDIKKELTGDNTQHSFFATLDPSYYKMQVYMYDMLVATKMIYPSDFNNDAITISIPTSTGVKFLIYYSDGTPITDATVELYSHKENLISSSNTDSKGQTLRFWISPTPSDNNFYIPIVYLNDEIQYTHQDLKLIPGSTDLKIITPWPSSADYLHITAKQDSVTTMNSWDNEYTAKLSNDDFEKSVFFNHGEAHFANLPLGTFNLTIFKQDNPKLLWANSTIVVSEKSNDVDVIVTEPTMPNNTEPAPISKSPPESHFSFVKQSVSGIQLFDDSTPYLKLTTDGDNSPVFTRSSKINQDLSNKNFIAEISVDNPDNVQELWFSFTSDNFESGWYAYAVPTGLISKELTKISITSDDLALTGTQTLSSIDRVQIRLRDDGTSPITFQTSNFSFASNNQTYQSCNCVAFRLDDIQDFFLDQVQMELIQTFEKNNVDLTIGVTANNIGRDIDLTEFVSDISANPEIELANHGWDHDDFSQFGTVGQEMLLLRSNEKINELFGITPSVFMPPENSFNDETIAALKSAGFTHYSSELDFAMPPFPLSGQSLYHFPETAFTGELNEERTRFVGIGADSVFNQIQKSISKFGFAVVTLHPQEFSEFTNQRYQNKVNYDQIEELKTLFSQLKENNIETVLISEINTEPTTEILVPQWVKNNAKWWIEERVPTEEFVNSLEFLITQQIIKTSQTESTGTVTNIPNWIKSNIEWWINGQISDSEFVSSAEFMIKKGIIQI